MTLPPDPRPSARPDSGPEAGPSPLAAQRPSAAGRRRLRGGLAAAALLAAAGAGAWGAAGWAVDVIERRADADVRAALIRGGFDWVGVTASGLRVTLTGTAEDEVQRVRALAQAGTAIDAGRIQDGMQVGTTPAPASDFRVEILRTDQGGSVIGLAPRGFDPAPIIRALGSGPITDLTSATAADAPAGWNEALGFAVTAAGLVPQGKLTVTPGHLSVTAIATSQADRHRIAAALETARPKGVQLETQITAPRPVIAPFALRLKRDGSGLHALACTADSAQTLERITAALQQAGTTATCVEGLGAPSPAWGDAAVAAVDALRDLPAGEVSIMDTAVTLNAPALVPPPRFEAARARLAAALPRPFVLKATLEPSDTATPVPHVTEFVADISANGARLRGPMTDERMHAAVDSFARARFGPVESTLQVQDALPPGWAVQVIAAMEAMADLREGTLSVTPERIRIEGVSGDQGGARRIVTLLGERVGPGVPYELALSYDPRLDPARGLPDGPQCTARMNAALGDGVAFRPNLAEFEGDPAPLIEALKTAMADCGDFRIEIATHTDSQGSEAFNLDLSQKRAEALRAAIGAAGLPVQNLTAKGYGEAQPIADNATDAGRTANRRVEFRLLSEIPQGAAPLDRATLSGKTEAPVSADQPVAAAPATTENADTPATTLSGRIPADGAMAKPQGTGDAAGESAPASQGGAPQSASATTATAEQDKTPPAAAGKTADETPADETNTALQPGTAASTALSPTEGPAAPGTALSGSIAVPAAPPPTGESDKAPTISGDAATSPTSPASSGSAHPGAAVSTPATGNAPTAPDEAVAARPAIILDRRLTGAPPELTGEDTSPAPAVTPTATPDPARAPEGAAAAAAIAAGQPTPDDVAAQSGIDIRGNRIEVHGDRLTTPVPPPLPSPNLAITAPGAGAGPADGSTGIGGPGLENVIDRPPPRPARSGLPAAAPAEAVPGTN